MVSDMMGHYYHLTRGKTYRLLGRATVQAGRPFVEGEALRIGRRGPLGDLEAIDTSAGFGREWIPITVARLQARSGVFPGDVLAYYQDEAGGQDWIRPWAEFHDGRFEQIDKARAAPASTNDGAKLTPKTSVEAEMERLRGRLAEVERQRDDLQAANNRYLQRARDAEAERDRLRIAAGALTLVFVDDQAVVAALSAGIAKAAA